MLGSAQASKKFEQVILPGQIVTATFTVTSGLEPFNGDLVGKASWKKMTGEKPYSDIVVEKVRNVNPLKSMNSVLVMVRV